MLFQDTLPPKCPVAPSLPSSSVPLHFLSKAHSDGLISYYSLLPTLTLPLPKPLTLFFSFSPNTPHPLTYHRALLYCHYGHPPCWMDVLGRQGPVCLSPCQAVRAYDSSPHTAGTQHVLTERIHECKDSRRLGKAALQGLPCLPPRGHGHQTWEPGCAGLGLTCSAGTRTQFTR